MNTLASIKACVEKPAPGEENRISDMKNSSNSMGDFSTQRAAFLTEKLWPSDTPEITITFLPEFRVNEPKWTPQNQLQNMRSQDGDSLTLDPFVKDDDEYNKLTSMDKKDAVKYIVESRISPILGIPLRFTDDPFANIKISFDTEGGAWSLVGTDCLNSNTATMNFGWLDVATVIHEFGHALGLIHEHQNPRGEPVDWNVPVVHRWANTTQGWDPDTTNRNIIDRYKLEQTNGSDYDPDSIMLYFFPKELVNSGEGTDGNRRLSWTDLVYISKTYPGGKLTPAEYFRQIYNEEPPVDMEENESSGTNETDTKDNSETETSSSEHSTSESSDNDHSNSISKTSTSEDSDNDHKTSERPPATLVENSELGFLPWVGMKLRKLLNIEDTNKLNMECMINSLQVFLIVIVIVYVIIIILKKIFF